MKKFAMLMLCLVLAFALAACAGTDTTPQGSVSDTVTVTDMKGEVAIPANPQRIVKARSDHYEYSPREGL